jgi:two-component system sensor histidine kinase YesM
MKAQKITSINSRFFRSMFQTLLLFLIILLISTSVVFYKHTLALETNSAIRQLDYISNQLDYYLASVNNYSKTIITDKSVQAIVSKFNNNNKEFNAIDQMNIKTEINHIIQSTPFIHSVSIYSPEHALIATTEIYPYPLNLRNASASDRKIWIPELKYSNKERDTEIHVLSLMLPFYSSSTGTMLGYVEIAIPESTISDIYKDNASNFSSLFIVDSDGNVQSSDGSIPLMRRYEDVKKLNYINRSNYKLTMNTIVFSEHFPELNWYLVNEINLLYFLQPTFTTLGISIIMALLCIIACLNVSRKVSRTITSPIYQLISHTQRVKEGEWIPVNESYNDSDIGLLFEEFNSMIIAQKKLKNDLLNSEKMKNKVALDLLQQQVNPHFLYNTLDNICSLAEIDEKETLIDLVMNLSAFYRQGLSNGHTHITVKEELAVTEAYLKIMKVRYYNRFDFHITCDSSISGYPCLKLLLQPIVENSIYHGIKELNGKGQLDILVTETPDSILFTIRDNGIGIREEDYESIWATGNTHFGIKNIHQRIQLYYGSEYGLTIANHPQGGCISTITIGKKEVSTDAT